MYQYLLLTFYHAYIQSFIECTINFGCMPIDLMGKNPFGFLYL
jgi:hypothetical protein